MELVEITETHSLRREQAADLLRELADSLSRHNGVDFLRDGMKLHVRVPDQVELEVEVEIESDESEIEIKLSW
ncbi:MAG: amphi-Trp domain-containing protein [Parahaliea sp.]